MDTEIKIDKEHLKVLELFLNQHKELFLKKGTHWAIVGPGGSGKTSMLKLIHQLFTHNHFDNGNIAYRSCFVDVKHHFKNINSNSAFFYQQRYSNTFAADSNLVSKYLETKHSKKGNKGYWTIEKVSDLFSLQPLMDKFLIQLSNGEIKRLRIAAALLENPDLLLLDNPLIGLDVVTRKKFEVIFNEIKSNGTKLIISSTADEIPNIATHIVLLKDKGKGRVFPISKFNRNIPPNSKENQTLPGKGALQKLFNKKEKKNFKYLVRLHKASIQYGETSIVKDIDWEIKPGEKWALSGPNGSGKSSILSLICADHPQSYSNDIVLFDRKRGSGETIWEIKEKIGFMSPELFQYFPGHIRCLQVVESGFYDTIGIFRKVPEKAKSTALELMKIFGIANLQDQPLRKLSATQQRLALLTRALIKNPYLLILDEPCQGFDKTQQEHFRDLVDAIAEISDMALIYVTHYEEQLPKCIENKYQL